MVSSSILSSQDEVPSSPPSMPPPMSSPSRRPGSHGRVGQKERRQASVTPRKFHRFFEPRAPHTINVGTTRRTLFDITPLATNRNGTRSSPIRRPGSRMSGQDNSPSTIARDFKKRKTAHSSHGIYQLELEEAPTTSVFLEQLNPSGVDPCASHMILSEVDKANSTLPGSAKQPSEFILPEKGIERVEDHGIAGRMLHLNLGYSTRSSRQHYVYPVGDYQDEVSGFYSRPMDIHRFDMARQDLECGIPFCTATCNTNSLIAVGDERGQIRLLESGQSGSPDFCHPYLSFKPHGNAIIDMSFSQDDSLLASGCGDRTVKVTDMMTQQVISTFAEHESSVKQVRFQPGASNNSVLASSGREGNIFIYDLRCNSAEAPVVVVNDWAGARATSRGLTVNRVVDAHRPGNQQRGSTAQRYSNTNWATSSERTEFKQSVSQPREYGLISVTSLAFLPAPTSHLLLSGSEFNSSIKVWDIRSIPRRNELAVPISSTAPPSSHSTHRAVGITSIAVSGDGSRIYGAARDNAVYVYSTSHLILGQAPELSTTELAKPKRPTHIKPHEGAGPIHAFRHPLLMVGSFYIKASIRPARNGQAELLAVGSTDQCALLFPTDERYLNTELPNLEKYWDTRKSSDVIDYGVRSTPRSRKTRRDRAVAREDDVCNGLEISERGTPLVAGHAREVSSVAWNSEGDLITIGDDYVVRRWHDGNYSFGAWDESRVLRRNGNKDGRRWGSGWADVNSACYDDSDGEVDSDDEVLE